MKTKLTITLAAIALSLTLGAAFAADQHAVFNTKGQVIATAAPAPAPAAPSCHQSSAPMSCGDMSHAKTSNSGGCCAH